MKVFAGVAGAAAVSLAGCVTPPPAGPVPYEETYCGKRMATPPTYTLGDVEVRLTAAKAAKAAMGLTDDAIKAMLKRPEGTVPPPQRYDRCALDVAQPGRCNIVFDLGAGGIPKNIVPVCTHFAFERDAARVVAGTVYQPIIVNGHAVDILALVQPMRFEMAE